MRKELLVCHIKIIHNKNNSTVFALFEVFQILLSWDYFQLSKLVLADILLNQAEGTKIIAIDDDIVVVLEVLLSNKHFLLITNHS